MIGVVGSNKTTAVMFFSCSILRRNGGSPITKKGSKPKKQ